MKFYKIWRTYSPESNQDTTAVAFPTRNQYAAPPRQCNTYSPQSLQRFWQNIVVEPGFAGLLRKI